MRLTRSRWIGVLTVALVRDDLAVAASTADGTDFLERKVEAELSTRCVFMQGAAGNIEPQSGCRPPGNPKSFGQTVADHVIAMARSIKTETPPHPSIRGMVNTFHFKTHVNLRDPRVAGVFERSYFPGHPHLRQAVRRIPCRRAEHRTVEW